jgi:hypothetical protein
VSAHVTSKLLEPDEAPGLFLCLTDGPSQAKLLDEKTLVQDGKVFLHLQKKILKNNILAQAHSYTLFQSFRLEEKNIVFIILHLKTFKFYILC